MSKRLPASARRKEEARAAGNTPRSELLLPVLAFGAGALVLASSRHGDLLASLRRAELFRIPGVLPPPTALVSPSWFLLALVPIAPVLVLALFSERLQGALGIRRRVQGGDEGATAPPDATELALANGVWRALLAAMALLLAGFMALAAGQLLVESAAVFSEGVFMLLRWLLVVVAMGLLLVSAADMAAARHRWARALRMTHRDQREEVRRLAGDARIRERQRAFRLRGQDSRVDGAERGVVAAREQLPTSAHADVPAFQCVASGAAGAVWLEWQQGTSLPRLLHVGFGPARAGLLRRARAQGLQVVVDDVLVRALQSVLPGHAVPKAVLPAVARLVATAQKASNTRMSS